MPLAGQSTSPTVPRHNVRVSHLSLQVADSVRTDIPTPNPIVDAVLGWNAPRQQRRTTRRAYWSRDEEVAEPNACFG